MRHFDLAGAAGRFLANPSGEAGRMRGGASRLIADVLGALDPERLGGMVRTPFTTRALALCSRFRRCSAQALDAAMGRERRHKPVIDAFVRGPAGGNARRQCAL